MNLLKLHIHHGRGGFSGSWSYIIGISATIDGGRTAIILFKKFYKMRCIGEGALHTNLGYGLRGGDKQQARAHQSLADKPTVWRHHKVTLELLFE